MEKESKLKKGILTIEIDGKLKGMYNTFRKNGDDWLAKVMTKGKIDYVSLNQLEAVLIKKYKGKTIKLKY